MQISTQSRKRLLFAALFLAILIPLFFAFALRAQQALLGFEAGSPLIDWVHQNTTGSGFLRKVTGDATFYSLVLLAKDSRLGALLFFQSIVCAAIALVLLWVTLYCKKSYLTPFTIAYTILSALIYLATMGDCAINSQAEEYCVLMLWGAYLPQPLRRDAGEERRPRVRHVHPLGERQNDAGRGDPPHHLHRKEDERIADDAARVKTRAERRADDGDAHRPAAVVRPRTS